MTITDDDSVDVVSMSVPVTMMIDAVSEDDDHNASDDYRTISNYCELFPKIIYCDYRVSPPSLTYGTIPRQMDEDVSG